MKLKTSFFNPTVLKKDVTRFAPLWGLYTVFMLMTLFLIWADSNEPARFAADAPYVTQMMGVVNFVYGGLCAVLLFGDLFQSKMAGMLHAMPMRREGWFLTHVTAGMLFCLVPNALGALLACLILQEYCYLAFIWLAVMILQFVFFFGVGVFSAQCAGNKLGAAAVYGLINFLAVLVAFLAETFYEPVLYGVVFATEKMFRCSPVVDFTCSTYMEVVYDNLQGVARFEGFDPNNWRYLWISFGVGLALLGCAVVLYRRRQLDSAGDFIAFRPAAPVFLVLYALCAGAALYFVANLFGTGTEYPFLVLGFAIGFFTGHMLLEKKVNVFQGKKWLGFGVLTLAFFLTITVTYMDPLGVTRYVPEVQDVARVRVSPYDASYYIENEYLLLEDSQDIMAITDAQKTLIRERPGTEGETMTVWLRYELKDGRNITRKYQMRVDSNEAKMFKTFFTDFFYVTGAKTVEELINGLNNIEFVSHGQGVPNVSLGSANYGEDWIALVVPDMRESEEVRGLIQALKADCDAGNMAQQWYFHRFEESVGTLNLEIRLQGDRRYDYKGITVFQSCHNTIEYLSELAEKQKPETAVVPIEEQ